MIESESVEVAAMLFAERRGAAAISENGYAS